MAERLLSSLAHRASLASCYFGYQRFVRALSNPEQSQRSILKKILQLSEGSEFGKKHQLSELSWEEFHQKLPLSEYQDWAPIIERQRVGEKNLLTASPCTRYQPTSGSTSTIKWIPYTEAFLSELDHTISPWLYDIYKTEKGSLNGRHYWSISWIPTEMRQSTKGNINDDIKLLPWWKRAFTSLGMAVPEAISHTESSDLSVMASLCYLASCQDLSVLSVWSPTFALNMLENLGRYRLEIESILSRGKWGPYQDKLNFMSCPKSSKTASLLRDWNGQIDPEFFTELWPNMALISCWDTSTSACWAKQLHQLFPKASFQGKGLFATEGAVTIPFKGHYPLTVNSHFYEFRECDSGKILASWQLEVGQTLQPIITTGSGLYRYSLRDRVRVSGFLHQTPCLEFLGRIDGTDMVGEKISPQLAQDILDEMEAFDVANPLTLVAVLPQEVGSRPFYLFLAEGNGSATVQRVLGREVEKKLMNSFHYRLAREVGQLAPVRCLLDPKARQIYAAWGIRKGMVMGNMKIEPLVLWEANYPEVIQEIIREIEKAEEGITISSNSLRPNSRKENRLGSLSTGL